MHYNLDVYRYDILAILCIEGEKRFLWMTLNNDTKWVAKKVACILTNFHSNLATGGQWDSDKIVVILIFSICNFCYWELGLNRTIF